MKNASYIFAIAAIALLGSARIHTEAQAEKSQRQTLQEMKDRNAKVIEQQTATLLKLDELKKESGQLRIFAGRT